MKRVIAYQLGFNAVWCACVFGALYGESWFGPAAAMAWIAFHLSRARAHAPEIALILFAGAFGAVADWVLIHIGNLEYVGSPEGAQFGPLWIVALWMAFATSINPSFAWLRGRMTLGALVGGLGGLAAYVAGQRLGVVAFDLQRLESSATLIGVWAIGIPLLVRTAQWCEVRSALRGASS